MERFNIVGPYREFSTPYGVATLHRKVWSVKDMSRPVFVFEDLKTYPSIEIKKFRGSKHFYVGGGWNGWTQHNTGVHVLNFRIAVEVAKLALQNPDIRIDKIIELLV